MKNTIIIIFALLTTLAMHASAADMNSPIGQWQTIDDETNKAKSVVRIYMDGDELKGDIVKLLATEDKGKICKKCKGSRANQPIEGMNFIWGLTQDGKEWKGGKILDPANGKEYKAKLMVTNGGKNLEVRGFIGFSLIGRTQVWNRVE
ncbi:DUF2147 domain-containing protein [Gynuella sp.]|uniref:DUF2147 domain-containing protein n=1 Tax=Gynuella sp. TaxID=2969146 RepID=UPI003D0F2944